MLHVRTNDCIAAAALPLAAINAAPQPPQPQLLRSERTVCRELKQQGMRQSLDAKKKMHMKATGGA